MALNLLDIPFSYALSCSGGPLERYLDVQCRHLYLGVLVCFDHSQFKRNPFPLRHLPYIFSLWGTLSRQSKDDNQLKLRAACH